ncbi:hypothetical protein M0802_012902 [Mischocyttarus mexicanus]|nr:hypothetical protein M0802_012902 [Mischocyttarus mexicanus]
MVDSPGKCGVVPGARGYPIGSSAGATLALKGSVAGDFNARSAAWDQGCRENARVRLLKEWTSRSGLFLLNDKGHSTCVRPQGSSVVDLVWVTGAIRDRTASCLVDDEESLSDHKYIIFSFLIGGDSGVCSYRDRRWADFPRWKTSGADRDRLGAALISADWTKPVGTLGAEAWVQWLRCSLKRACDIAMPRVGPRNGGRRMVHWWNEEVAARRRDANAARRKWTRGRGKLESSRCFHCDEPLDDADHTLTACSCWAEQRGVLQSAIGRDTSLSRIVGRAVRDPDVWRAFAQFADYRKVSLRLA